jgi:hypothetical protein
MLSINFWKLFPKNKSATQREIYKKGGSFMSKGNGRFRKNSMGNGMDKFHGRCNGINSNKEIDPYDYSSLQDVPDSDIISGNINRSNKDKGFKSKLK